MTNPNHPHPAEEAPSSAQQPSLHSPSPLARILLLVSVIVGAVLTGICPDLLSASVFAALTAGIFSYTFLLTFSPLLFAVIPISVIAAYVMTFSFYHAFQSLLFLPLAVSVVLSMLRLKNKTQAVLRGAVAIGIALAVLFLISYMMQHGTIAADALKQSYNDFFENMRTMMTDSMLDAYETMEQAAATAAANPDLSHPIIGDGTAGAVTDAVTQDAASAAKQNAATEAYLRAMVDLSVNSVKLACPALFAIAAQVLAYIALTVYRALTKLCRTPFMLPRTYRITVSRTAAVIFVIAYLINMFPIGDSMSLTQIASANLATMMMPGIFLMGLNSLARRAKDPLRRRSFIITAVVLGFLVLVYPSYAIFFVLIDGIGEVFFSGRSIF